MFALAGALCGRSPLLPFVGGVSLPGGATCRDNPEQAKTVPEAAPRQAKPAGTDISASWLATWGFN